MVEWADREMIVEVAIVTAGAIVLGSLWVADRIHRRDHDQEILIPESAQDRALRLARQTDALNLIQEQLRRLPYHEDDQRKYLMEEYERVRKEGA
jgi:hypothetical protein